jgi:hypothetical protein
MSEAATAMSGDGGSAGASEAAAPAAIPNGQLTPDVSGGQPDPAPAGTPANDWTSSLASENTGLVQTKGWKSPDEVATAYRNLEKLIGRKQADAVQFPGPDTPPEEADKFWQGLGVPEDKAGYGFEAPENISGYDKELLDWFADVAHSAKLPKDAANAVHRAYAEKMAEMNTRQMQMRDQQIESWNGEIDRMYGAARDDKIGLARRAIGALAGEAAPQIVEYLERTGLGSFPPLVDMFVKTAGMMQEDQLAAHAPRAGAGARTPGEVQSDIDKLTGVGLTYDQQRKLPYWDDRHPDHRAMVDKVSKLHEARDPDGGRPLNDGSMFRVG